MARTIWFSCRNFQFSDVNGKYPGFLAIPMEDKISNHLSNWKQCRNKILGMKQNPLLRNVRVRLGMQALTELLCRCSNNEEWRELTEERREKNGR